MFSSIGIIITAGGVGKRMNSNQPKQFMEIEGKPIFILTILHLKNVLIPEQIILTMPKGHINKAVELLERYSLKDVLVVEGGKERFHSVKNALKLINTEITFIHDAVRPFVSSQVLKVLQDRISKVKAVIPVLPVFETLRKFEGERSFTVNRDHYRTVQTPQVFHTSLLKEAYDQEFNQRFTDDASVVESLGQKIDTVTGNRENIKITVPEDLQWGTFLLKIRLH